MNFSSVLLRLALILSITAIPFATEKTIASAENCGWAMVDADNRSLGVSVGDCAGNWLAEEANLYTEINGERVQLTQSRFISAGCKLPCRFIIQTREDPATGNVVGYNGESPGISVKYDDNTNSFSVYSTPVPVQNQGQGVTPTPSAPPKVTLVIKDGVATDTSGRSYDVASGITTTTTLSQEQYQQLVKETNRIDSAKNQRQTALSQAQLLASQTPGVERCVSWSGYLENGQECAIATVNNDTVTVQSRSVSNSLVSSDSKTVLNIDSSTGTSRSDSLTVTVKATNEFTIPVLKSESVEVKGAVSELSSLVQKIETNQKLAAEIDKSLKKLESIKKVSASAMVKLPDARSTSETAISLTPNVCTVVGIQVSRVSKGTCTVSYTITSDAGNSYTTEKSFNFR
jgi:hypothetical protein